VSTVMYIWARWWFSEYRWWTERADDWWRS